MLGFTSKTKKAKATERLSLAARFPLGIANVDIVYHRQSAMSSAFC